MIQLEESIDKNLQLILKNEPIEAGSLENEF